jgi:hypothetical protein
MGHVGPVNNFDTFEETPSQSANTYKNENGGSPITGNPPLKLTRYRYQKVLTTFYPLMAKAITRA